MRWPFARYGTRELVIGVVVLGAATALALWQLPAAAVVPVLAFAFLLAFFRDPERTPQGGERMLLSPADGRVADVEEVVEEDFLREPAVRVGVFMSLFNVHVNRAPLSGRVVYRDYRPGKFRNAMSPAASRENECLLLGIEGADGTRILVKQIAGLIARRIVCARQVGDAVARGERFGMVKFGSRLEVYVPRSAPFEVDVAVGERVRAGLTVLGQFRAEEGTAG